MNYNSLWSNNNLYWKCSRSVNDTETESRRFKISSSVDQFSVLKEMARNTEESVRWLRDQTQASSDQADEQEVSSCIGKNSEIVKPQRKRNTVCVISCLSISLILNVTLGIVVVCLVRNKQAKINNEPVHLELSYESRTGDDTICVPCRGPLSTDLTLTNSDFVSFHQSLCCGSGESLSSLVKLVSTISFSKPLRSILLKVLV